MKINGLLTTGIILAAILSACSSGKPDCSVLVTRAETKYNNGNFLKLSELADSIRKVCPGKHDLLRKADSLVQISERIRLDFSMTEEQFLERVGSYGLQINDTILEWWNRNNWIEWRMIDGEKRYFNRAASNLRLLKLFYEEKEKQILENSSDPEMIERLDHTRNIIAASKKKIDPAIPVNMKITYTITVVADAVPDGETIRCWMPFPKENYSRQQKIELLSASDPVYKISPDSAVHRTIYMENTARKGIGTEFNISFRYQSAGRYIDLNSANISPYDKTSSLYKKYTSEELPNVRFTEDIKRVADSITSENETPAEITRKIYLWFKENIPWTGALEYSTMENIPEYVMKHRRGDCGMQTFVYMSMLRYKGIPVRWQSGWKVPPGYKNLHDWCEIYFEEIGWVPSDISYDLQFSEYRSIREFFISGIDSYRLIVNDGVAGRLYPEKIYLRSEPYDFQRGEVEWKGGNLYFDKWKYRMDIEYQAE